MTAVEQTVGFRKGAPQPDWWVESSDELQPLLEAKKATKNALDAAHLTGTPAPDRLAMLTKASMTLYVESNCTHTLDTHTQLTRTYLRAL